MDPAAAAEGGATLHHVVAMPYPGRGHINPMMNLCHLLPSRSTSSSFLFTFVVTEEWLAFISSDGKPANVRFATLPNVVPSELVRAADMQGFVEAVQTKLEGPFEQLLDRLEPPAKLIIADTFLQWAVQVGNRRNIPVASFWPMSASVFSIFYHFDLIVQNQHFPVELSGAHENVDYIPGLSAMCLADLPTIFYEQGSKNLYQAVDAVSVVPRAQYLLFTSVSELELEAIDALKAKLPIPVYTFGPNIPYFKLIDNPSSTTHSDGDHSYFKWLDSKPEETVLYVSLGSYLSVSSAQMDEIEAGLKESGVPYLWVARGESSRFSEVCDSGGLIVPWCDQLRVLSHSSVGGFLTHCGWNSVMESGYCGVPMITFPIFMDQTPNSKLIVNDWKTGWRVKEATETEKLVKREEIAHFVGRFMDLEGTERKETTRRAKELQEICRQAITSGGSSNKSLGAFIEDIEQGILDASSSNSVA
ncbi:hypothetical protein RJ640_025428 [Escallonia rubra]|uniref:Glycosyltransferase n=1 Tax=Escallonia rubra TaxID=112253 RepID=A0AA88RVC9_9ASTE|nr:hypothetical protein RJ640_025428 [Escallonia rubra]